MQLDLESTLGEMAPSDTQFENLKKRVKDLEQKPGQTAPNSSWIQRHQVLTWLISLTVTIVALSITFYAGVMPHIEKDDAQQITNQVTEGLKQPLQKIGQMSDEIAEINGTLKAWAPFMAPEVLKRSASANQDEFNKSLPDLKKAIQAAAQTNTTVSNGILQQISEKLQRTSESSPEYWPTVLQFIQFASAQFVNPADVPLPSARYDEMHNVSCAGAAHCIEASHRAILLDGGNIPNSIFQHCRIKFTNNPVGLQGSRFIDCIFEMPANVTPTPYLKNSAKILLASNLLQVAFPG
jgi:hypothetical protein